MKNIFIELTEQDGTKFMLNILHLIMIEPYKSGTSVQSSIGDSFIHRKVRESYEEVKAKLAAMNHSTEN